MLTLDLNGKKVTTTEDKQILTINDIPVEVERIGNAIYVNKTHINVIIPEKTKGAIPVGKVLAGGILVGAAVLGWQNQELVVSTATSTFDFIVPYVDSAIDWVMSYVNGTETATAPAVPAE